MKDKKKGKGPIRIDPRLGLENTENDVPWLPYQKRGKRERGVKGSKQPQGTEQKRNRPGDPGSAPWDEKLEGEQLGKGDEGDSRARAILGWGCPSGLSHVKIPSLKTITPRIFRRLGKT